MRGKIFLIVFWMVCLGFPLRAEGISESVTSFVPGQLIIKFRPEPRNVASIASVSLDSLAERFNGKRVQTLETSSRNGAGIQSVASEEVAVYQFENEAELAEIQQVLETHPQVTYAEPNYYVYASSQPNDTYYGSQTYFHQNQFDQFINWPSDQSMIVAVVDTGVDVNHEDLSEVIAVNTQEVINGRDDDDNGMIDDRLGANFYKYSFSGATPDHSDGFGHGTHIAGIIAAKSNNRVGVAGVNQHVKILNVKFLDNQGRGSQFDGAAAIRYAVDRGAKVINCSWGYTRYASVLREAVEYAVSRGVIIVAAAGNSASSTPEYPAAFEGVISVGSVDSSLEISSFSNYGSTVDFVAGGRQVMSTLPGNQYGYKSGTSQSAGFVSGIVAHVLSQNPVLEMSQVISVLKESTLDLQSTGRDNQTGYGYVVPPKLQEAMINSQVISDEQAEALVQEESDSESVEESLAITDVLNFPNPVRQEGTSFGMRSNKTGHAKIKVYNLSGRHLATVDASLSGDYNAIPWNATDDSGRALDNGTYIYVVHAESSGESQTKKGLLSILR